MKIYYLRLEVLATNTKFRHYEYTRDNPKFVYVHQLTVLAAYTRDRLLEAFDRFFCRYKTESVDKFSYVFESQSFLHPKFKNFSKTLDRIVKSCNSNEERCKKILRKVKDKIMSNVSLTLCLSFIFLTHCR
jgi:hypothetical protein